MSSSVFSFHKGSLKNYDPNNSFSLKIVYMSSFNKTIKTILHTEACFCYKHISFVSSRECLTRCTLTCQEITLLWLSTDLVVFTSLSLTRDRRWRLPYSFLSYKETVSTHISWNLILPYSSLQGTLSNPLGQHYSPQISSCTMSLLGLKALFFVCFTEKINISGSQHVYGERETSFQINKPWGEWQKVWCLPVSQYGPFDLFELRFMRNSSRSHLVSLGFTSHFPNVHKQIACL